MPPATSTSSLHSHDFHVTGDQPRARTLRVALLTLATMAVEIAAGLLFHSLALFADGCHMATHAVALGIAWLAFVLAGRHAADQRFVFGVWKIEILGGFVSAILLGLTGAAMAWLACARLLHPVTIQFNQAIAIAVLGLVVNLVSIFMLDDHEHEHEHDRDHDHAHAHEDVSVHDHDHAAHASKRHNLNLRAAYLHVVADALTSVLAILALLGGKYFGWNWLDPAMGLVGAALILRWTVQLLGQTGGILLDRESDAAPRRAVQNALAGGDARITDLHVWRVGQGRYACIVSLAAARPLPLAVYKARLAAIPGLIHATVEIAVEETP
jgi:cation diffusion facilitator family transporter